MERRRRKNPFERKVLDLFPLNPAWRERFVNDTNIKWNHGKENLERFFNRLNSISSKIKFTMEVEENKSIPFLDVLITRKEDGTLGHHFFWKKNHTCNYNHAEPYHHSTKKFSVLNTLVVRALRIFDAEHLKEEINHLMFVFKGIVYKDYNNN